MGIIGCHGDTHYSTDINADLLRATSTSTTVPVIIQGNVACATCDSGYGMAVVVSSVIMGNVAHGLMEGIGNYKLDGQAKEGDTLTIIVTLTQKSGPVSQGAKTTVPVGGGTITQDFQF